MLRVSAFIGIQHPFRRSVTSLKLAKTNLLSNTDIFVFDCDGVLWRGGHPIPGAMETISALRNMKKMVYFVTNSTESRSSLIKKFLKFGIEVKEKEVLSASFAAAAYLKQLLAPSRAAYVLGEPGVEEEIRLMGIPCIDGNQFNHHTPNLGSGGRVEFDGNVGAVVVGFDPFINYYKIQYAQLCINSIPECVFVATNLDATCHQTDAQLWADAGAMVGAIKGCTGIEPIVVGKPSPFLVDYIVQHNHVTNRARICMVGDRLDTDIVFGKQNGMTAILSLTGVTTWEQLHALQWNDKETIKPDYYVQSIVELLVE